MGAKPPQSFIPNTSCQEIKPLDPAFQELLNDSNTNNAFLDLMAKILHIDISSNQEKVGSISCSQINWANYYIELFLSPNKDTAWDVYNSIINTTSTESEITTSSPGNLWDDLFSPDVPHHEKHEPTFIEQVLICIGEVFQQTHL